MVPYVLPLCKILLEPFHACGIFLHGSLFLFEILRLILTVGCNIQQRKNYQILMMVGLDFHHAMMVMVVVVAVVVEATGLVDSSFSVSFFSLVS